MDTDDLAGGESRRASFDVLASALRRTNRLPPSPSPMPVPTAPVTPKTSWRWQCHVCHSQYTLACTRRCLECSHEFCSSARTTPGKASTSSSRRRSRMHRGGPCAHEFNYAPWAAWGAYRRHYGPGARRDIATSKFRKTSRWSAAFDAFATYEPVPAGDGSRRSVWKPVADSLREDMELVKEGMYVRREHDCSFHCDFPSECRLAMHKACVEGRARSVGNARAVPIVGVQRAAVAVAEAEDADEDFLSLSRSSSSDDDDDDDDNDEGLVVVLSDDPGRRAAKVELDMTAMALKPDSDMEDTASFHDKIGRDAALAAPPPGLSGRFHAKIAQLTGSGPAPALEKLANAALGTDGAGLNRSVVKEVDGDVLMADAETGGKSDKTDKTNIAVWMGMQSAFLKGQL